MTGCWEGRAKGLRSSSFSSRKHKSNRIQPHPNDPSLSPSSSLSAPRPLSSSSSSSSSPAPPAQDAADASQHFAQTTNSSNHSSKHKQQPPLAVISNAPPGSSSSSRSSGSSSASPALDLPEHRASSSCSEPLSKEHATAWGESSAGASAGRRTRASSAPSHGFTWSFGLGRKKQSKKQTKQLKGNLNQPQQGLELLDVEDSGSRGGELPNDQPKQEQGVLSGLESRVTLVKAVARSSLGLNYQGRFSSTLEQCSCSSGAQNSSVQHQKTEEEQEAMIKLAEIPDEEQRKNVKKRASRLLSAPCHPNIVDLLDVDDCKATLYVTERWAYGVQLLDAASACSVLCEKDVAMACKQLLGGLSHLQKFGIHMPAVRPENLLFFADSDAQNGRMQGRLQLVDTALACFKLEQTLRSDNSISQGLRSRTNNSGTTAPSSSLDFIPPELRGAKSLGTEDDLKDGKGAVFSVGVLVSVLLSGHPPASERGGLLVSQETDSLMNDLGDISCLSFCATSFISQATCEASIRPSISDAEALDFIGRQQQLPDEGVGTQESLALYLSQFHSCQMKKAMGGLEEKLLALGAQYREEEAVKKKEEEEQLTPLRKHLKKIQEQGQRGRPSADKEEENIRRVLFLD